MKQPNNATIYNTALYLRLSRDDELQGESGSIRTQRMMLRGYAHEHGLNVWGYTGWTFEHLLTHGSDDQKALLKELDVLVDGPFVLAERSLSLAWRGSKNQRVIDVRASLAAGQAVLVETQD